MLEGVLNETTDFLNSRLLVRSLYEKVTTSS